MKWVLIEDTHINTDTVTDFRWSNGVLQIHQEDCKRLYARDPDRQFYLKLCGQLGVRPYEGVQE